MEAAITALGLGFIEHPANAALRDNLTGGDLTGQDYYRQLLRIVYRLLFLFVAEDRNLLLDPNASDAARACYGQFYSTGRLRRMAESFKGTRHPDLFEGLRLVMRLLSGDSNGAGASLGLVPLGSFLFSDEAVHDVIDCQISNQHLLDAVRALSLVYDDNAKVYRSVDYKNLGPEELGSVYESLLELHPQINIEARRFALATAGGNERKTTGSYYTPTSLINALLDSALDPVLDEAVRQGETAILDLKVCDPACGSGHFLIAAANRMAKRLAEIRTGEEEPPPLAIQEAKRDIIGHCIYGVDINPMAVELCKVNLWMEALEPGKPLSFLDHRIQCGNSLLGTTPRLMANGIPDEAFQPIEGDDRQFVSSMRRVNREERKQREKGVRQMSLFEAPPADYGYLTDAMHQLAATPDDTLADVRRKEAQYTALADDPEYVKARLLADAWCAAFVWEKRPFAPTPGPSPSGGGEQIREMASKAMRDMARDLRQRQTPAEQILWEALRKNRLGGLGFRRQHPVANTNFVVDFFCYSANLIVELDGEIHHQQQEADAIRQHDLEALGYRVIRFPNERVHTDLESVLAEILIAAQAKVPPPEGEGFRVGAHFPLTDLLYRRLEDNPLADNLQAVRETVVALTDRYGFFHWHVAFPDVFTVPEDVTSAENDQTGWHGGFDVILGNPPWERVQFEEQAFFASRNPEIANESSQSKRRDLIQLLKMDDPTQYAEWLTAKQTIDRLSHLLRTSGLFPLSAVNKFNLYAVFSELVLHIQAKAGYSGIIVKGGYISDKLASDLFEWTIRQGRLKRVLEFENRLKLFPAVHSSERFVIVINAITDAKTEFYFNLFDTSELQDKNARSIPMSLDDILLLSPNTRNSPSFTSRRDFEVAIECYRVGVPFLVQEPLANPWGISIDRYINVSDFSGEILVRSEYSAYEGSTKYTGLYEGKLIHQYNHRFATYPCANDDDSPYDNDNLSPNFSICFYRFLPDKTARRRNPHLSQSSHFVAFRDIARARDEHTLIGTIIPAEISDYTIRVIQTENDWRKSLMLVSMLNSYMLDFLVRQRIGGGTHLSNYILEQLPIIPPHTYTPALLDFIVPRVLELSYTAWDLQPFAQDVGYSGPPFVWDEERRFLMRCELDALYFHLYQIPRDDVDYIMETFPIVKRKDEQSYGSYVTKSTILEIYDQMASLPSMPVPAPKDESATYNVPDVSQWATWLNPPPADPSVAHEDTREN